MGPRAGYGCGRRSPRFVAGLSVVVLAALALPLGWGAAPSSSVGHTPIAGVAGGASAESAGSGPGTTGSPLVPRLGPAAGTPIPGGNWANVTGALAPSSRAYATVAWDPATSSMILFGGCPATGKYYSIPCTSVIPDNDTWSWNATTMNWTEVSELPQISAALGAAAMTWDAADGYLLRFGGMELNAAGFDLGTSSATWTYSSSTWTQLNPALSPPRRDRASMTFVPGPGGNVSSGSVLMFGGLSCRTTCATGTYLNDTWEFSGGAWTNVTNRSASPSARAGAGLVYDPVRGEALLFGGVNSTGGTLNDTWAWNATSRDWTNLSATSAGPDLGIPAPVTSLTYYNATPDGYPLLCAALNDTVNPANESAWEYTAAGRWVRLSIPGANWVPAREGAAVAYDPAAHGVLAFGGLGLNGLMRGYNATYLYRDFVAAPSAMPSDIDLGQPIQFNATIYGNRSPPNSLLWQFGDGSTNSSENLSYTYADAGNYSVNLTARDSGWGDRLDTVSRFVNVTVNPQFELLDASASPPAVDLGLSTTLTLVTTGGTRPISYAYQGLPSGCASANASTIHCTPTGAGNSTIEYWANDSAGESLDGSLELNVTSDLGATFAVAPAVVDVQQNVTFTTTTNGGGAPPLEYEYGALPAGCSSENTGSFWCTVESPGSFNVTMNLTDEGGGIVRRVTLLTIHPDPEITSFTASAPTIELGRSVNLTVSAQGGTGSLSTEYVHLPPGCTTSDSFTLECTPAAAGTYSVGANVTDSAGVLASSAPLVLTVVPALAIGGFAAAPPVLDLGGHTTLTANVAGGEAPYLYAYAGLPTGCESQNSGSFGCTPTAAGTRAVELRVTDALGISESSTLSILVNPPLRVTDVGPTSSVAVGARLTIQVNVTGGQGPYAFAYRGLPTGCTSLDAPTVPCQPTAAGNYTWTVTVNDSVGGGTNSSGTVQVLPAANSGGSSSTSGNGDQDLLVGAAVLGLVVVAVVAALWLRRRAPGTGSSISPPNVDPSNSPPDDPGA